MCFNSYSASSQRHTYIDALEVITHLHTLQTVRSYSKARADQFPTDCPLSLRSSSASESVCNQYELSLRLLTTSCRVASCHAWAG